MDLEEALAQIRRDLDPVQELEIVPVADSLGRILAEPLLAPVDLPPFPASAMDGYALSLPADGQVSEEAFAVVGESLAGHPWSGVLTEGQCVRVFTGAVVPDGADQVVVQEEVASLEDGTVRFRPHRPSESFVRPIGHDIRRGAQLLERGTRLTPFAIGTMAAAGIGTCTVYRKLAVGIFSTGDELVDNDVAPQDLAPGQIYDSNRITVLNLLAGAPCELKDLGRLPDQSEATLAALQSASQSCDMLITSGGVSVGDADFVTDAIRQLGELSFWRLNLKPGKPLALGKIGHCVLFGLPGNPVSTIVTLLMVAKPALFHMAGSTGVGSRMATQAYLGNALRHSPGRAEFQRGTAIMADGRLIVSSTGDQSSNRLSSFRNSNCLIHIPKEADDLPAGSLIEILPFDGLLS